MSASPADRTRRFLQRIALTAAPDDLFAGQRVELVAEAWSPALEVAAALATTLLLRLDSLAPVIHLQLPGTRSRALPRLGNGPLIDALAAEHAGFSSVARLTDAPADGPVARITLGGDGPDAVNVDGWRVAVGGAMNTTSGDGVAAPFAGVLAANDIFQALLASVGVRVSPFRGCVSLWDLRLDGADGPPISQVIDLGGVAFAACGGVASATGWALALHQLTGSPVLVDPDFVDEDATNLNRHLTASFVNLGDAKAPLLGELLRTAGAEPVPVVDRWSGKVAGEPEIVIASPDHDGVRREVQFDLPRVLLSAGTGDDGVYQVARHDFLTGACASCISRADLTDQTPIAGAARRLGVSEEDLAPHLHSDEPLPASLLDRMKIDRDAQSALEGTAGRDLLEAVCAHVRVSPTGPALSAPTLAAAPGVLLASELIKERADADVPLRSGANTLMTSVLSGPHSRWLRKRDKRPGCECTDELYASFYRTRWGSTLQRKGCDGER